MAKEYNKIWSIYLDSFALISQHFVETEAQIWIHLDKNFDTYDNS